MLKRYKLIFSDTARDDIREIFAYIARENPQNAEKILEKIETKITALGFFPQKGRVVPEFLEQNIKNYRELQEYPWRIIYFLGGRNVVIAAVLDSRRDLKDLLVGKFL
ncbi:MAG: type II toxin-antitoxin system RelE/ParE family toxin [Candidatus Margulisbacteria bacterium]|jgi:toxin ParE1/3/4|nr:type II toxin-antitoxin system RelE/ParE family toxin [Candidatus Margulisiibacteriota bacterium]